MDQYPIPSPALDDRLGWVGTSGSGKTYNASAGVERLFKFGARVVVIDPLDVWWGLRLLPDGKPSPHNVVIFGGEHGDIALSEQAGKLIGETVATMGESCIVSLGGLTTKASERRFMLAFLSAIYANANGDPVHLVFDEADMWAPQQLRDKDGDAAKLLGMVETVVRRGRIRGFIPWLISQRPAVINKDVLSQIDGLVTFKLTSVQDRDAIGDWVKGQADLDQWKAIWASLPTMQQGQGVVWVPGREILATAQFPAKATFDSSRTPKRGERRERRDLKPLNLDALKDRLASIEEDVKANDPKALKAEIARLALELRRAEKTRPVSAPALAPSPAKADSAALEAARAEGEQIGLAKARAALDALSNGRAPRAARTQHVKEARAPVVPVEGITGPQQRILNATAWWAAFGIDDPANEQVGFIAGYSPGSGNFNNLKGQLRSMGLLEYPGNGRMKLTTAGEAKAEALPIALTRDAFQAAVRAKLKGPQVRLLDPVIAAYPDEIASDAVAEAAGYSAGSGNFNNLRGQLRTIGLIDYPSPGMVRAADWLFPG